MIKKLIQIYFFMVLHFAGLSQQATISAVMDGRKTRQAIITETPVTLTLHRVKFKNVHSLMLLYKEPESNVYKRSIMFSNESGVEVYHAQESKPKHGSFSINAARARSIMFKENLIKVYLLEDPSNDLMALPSRRKLLIEIHFI